MGGETWGRVVINIGVIAEREKPSLRHQAEETPVGWESYEHLRASEHELVHLKKSKKDSIPKSQGN